MHHFYKNLLDNLTQSVLMLDADNCIRYMNPAAEMLFGVSSKRMEGENLVALIRDRFDFFEVVRDARNTGHSFTRREARLLLHNGRDLAADYSISPLLQEGGDAVLVEIEQRERLIRITREEESRTQQQTTRELLRGLAHEIKNPLGGIRGAAQLLNRVLPDEELQDYTGIIIDEADRLRNLVDRMLGPRQALEKRSLNIHLILERIHQLISAETEDAIAFERDYDPSIPDIEGDQEQLIQALLNIVRNAVEVLLESATPNPRICLRTRAIRQFTLGAERHRLVSQILIQDNGPGIPASLRENLFYPMISGRASGSGLGLSIAQSIVNQHQGLIECQSEPGNTQFIVYIPLESCYGGH